MSGAENILADEEESSPVQKVSVLKTRLTLLGISTYPASWAPGVKQHQIEKHWPGWRQWFYPVAEFYVWQFTVILSAAIGLSLLATFIGWSMERGSDIGVYAITIRGFVILVLVLSVLVLAYELIRQRSYWWQGRYTLLDLQQQNYSDRIPGYAIEEAKRILAYLNDEKTMFLVDIFVDGDILVAISRGRQRVYFDLPGLRNRG